MFKKWRLFQCAHPARLCTKNEVRGTELSLPIFEHFSDSLSNRRFRSERSGQGQSFFSVKEWARYFGLIVCRLQP